MSENRMFARTSPRWARVVVGMIVSIPIVVGIIIGLIAGPIWYGILIAWEMLDDFLGRNQYGGRR